MTLRTRLIVNADDYGYFPEVSAGILAAARQGVVRATGVMSNSPHFRAGVAGLRETPELEVGVHLNLTHGRPLTHALARALRPWGGELPGKMAMARAILTRRVPLAVVLGECRAQIEACREQGLQPVFLNSHEHLHMLPGLYPALRELGRELGIVQLRHVQPDPAGGGSGVLRGLLLGTLALLQRRPPQTPRFLGLGGSGRLSLGYLQRILGGLVPGGVYELMCHPGQGRVHAAPSHVQDYHDWEAERRLLCSTELKALLAAQNIDWVGYRDLADG